MTEVVEGIIFVTGAVVLGLAYGLGLGVLARSAWQWIRRTASPNYRKEVAD